ncbi:hypothetical protein C8T65DRAFT_39679 [Cerioporus squamosus]|nr:hypothetical protein C8T65DRAFT_39679 [Cerioporus squamosus]
MSFRWIHARPQPKARLQRWMPGQLSCGICYSRSTPVRKIGHGTTKLVLNAIGSSHQLDASFGSRWRSSTDRTDRGGSILSVDISGPAQPSLTTKGHQIYVRPSYVDTFERIWRAATLFRPGALISGQPGISKTVFLWYMLIRLLQEGQVVLLHMPGNRPLLFLHDKVYIRKPSLIPDDGEPNLLPVCSEKLGFIWSLFDIAAPTAPPYLATRIDCFLVQAPFPDPARYAGWIKNNFLVYKGALPLWTRDELRAAFPLYEYSDPLREDLQAVLAGWPHKKLRGRKALTDALLRAYGEERPQSVDSMLETLMDIAINVSGYVPHDVYAAMYDLNAVTSDHGAALAISHTRALR